MRAEGEGLIASLRKLAETAVAILTNRFELFAVELQEEKARLLDLLLRVALIVSGVFLTIGLGVLALLFLFWEHRLLVSILLLLLSAAGTTAAVIRLRAAIKEAPLPFSSTIRELQKDKQCCGPANLKH